MILRQNNADDFWGARHLPVVLAARPGRDGVFSASQRPPSALLRTAQLALSLSVASRLAAHTIVGFPVSVAGKVCALLARRKRGRQKKARRALDGKMMADRKPRLSAWRDSRCSWGSDRARFRQKEGGNTGLVPRPCDDAWPSRDDRPALRHGQSEIRGVASSGCPG